DKIFVEALAPLLPTNIVKAGRPNELRNAVQEVTTAADAGRAVVNALTPNRAGMSKVQAAEAVARALPLMKLGSDAERAVGLNSVNASAADAAKEFLEAAESAYGKARTERGDGSARIWLDGLIKNQRENGAGEAGRDFPSC